MKIKGLFAVVIIALAGCASPPRDIATFSTDEIASHVKKSTSEYEKTITYIGPSIGCSSQKGDFCQYQLMASKDKSTGKFGTYSVSITDNYYGDNWRFYNSASFPGGNTRQVVKGKSDVKSGSRSCCSYFEGVLVVVSESELKQGEIKFRLNSESGFKREIHVPGNVLKGFLQGIRSN